MEIWKTENYNVWDKNTLDRINDRVDTAEEKISKLEGQIIKIIPKKTTERKRIK